MSKETIFADGLYFNAPHDKSPEFVIGNLSIEADRFCDWLRQHAGHDGKVRVSILRGKSGKPYCKLDTFEPKQPDQKREKQNTGDDGGAIPF